MREDLLKELGILYRTMIDNQVKYLDRCTYTIIADLSSLYEAESGICDYLLSIPEITHCLWGNIYNAPNISGHEFEELKFRFKLPEILLSAPGIYRLIKTEYDHYSDQCLSYFPPGIENALQQCKPLAMKLCQYTQSFYISFTSIHHYSNTGLDRIA